MMNALSLDKASYIVEQDNEIGTFGFVTDSGGVILWLMI